MTRGIWIVVVILCATTALATESERRPASRTAHVDDKGVVRWGDTAEELALFGVNYYPPFAVDYWGLEWLGYSHEEVIRQDLDQMVRLNLDLLRMHVWDREIADKQGNLLDNRHVQLMDCVIAEAKKRGIYTHLTPMCWWPTPNPTTGFSDEKGIENLTSNRDMWPIQQRFLKQMMEHVNPYTGMAYKDDPAIIIIELINEPKYWPEVDTAFVTEYIKALARAVKSTGCKKPLFYNAWKGHHQAVVDADIDGCTFSWYPTGLQSYATLTGNILGRLDRLDDMEPRDLPGRARAIYEFDAADVPGSYAHAAMARAFRRDGAQLACQFQYDPTPLARCNTSWQTHYMNLIMTPGKALGLMIAGEAFRDWPRYQDYPAYPQSATFGPFHLDGDRDLAEMVTDTAFLYTNDTVTMPPHPDKLTRIAGCGSSPLVKYDGTGAYFLDKVGENLWRLEIYPDAVWVNDPFGLSSMSREVARAVWREHVLTFALLKQTVDVKKPGVYYLDEDGNCTKRAKRDGVVPDFWLARDKAFFAPHEDDAKDFVVYHAPLNILTANADTAVAFTAVGPRPIDSAVVVLKYADDPELHRIPASVDKVYNYVCTIPGKMVNKDLVGYAIELRAGRETRLFPVNMSTNRALDGASPDTQIIFRAWQAKEPPELGGDAIDGAELSRVDDAVRVVKEDGFTKHEAYLGIWRPLTNKSEHLDLAPKEPFFRPQATVVIEARAARPATTMFRLALVRADGQSYGANVPITPEWREWRVPLSRFATDWKSGDMHGPEYRLKALAFSMGYWLYQETAGQPQGFDIRSVRIEPAEPFWALKVTEDAAPIQVFDAALDPVAKSIDYEQSMVSGSAPDKIAVRLTVPGFEEKKGFAQIVFNTPRAFNARRDAVKNYNAVRVRIRANAPATKRVQLTLREMDGSPWAHPMTLTNEWQDIVMKLADFELQTWDGPHPARQGKGDYPHPDALATCMFGVGGWILPDTWDQPQSFDVERVEFIKSE